jgi:serine-type D-Ala-D-Ala carboxypeptidase (penicillin-binding protein 5/6)
VVVVVVVLVACVVAGVVRLETKRAPALTERVLLADSVRFPGAAPVLAWPSEGEAAVSVSGIGVMGSRGGSTPIPIASLAKVMTALLVLHNHPIAPGQAGFHVTITAADVADEQARESQGQSTVAVAAGEVLSEYQLLEALLVPSANNVATILADHDAGTQAAFLRKMNAEAKALHMAHTDYTDPSGFDASTVSTASDQLRLARVAMRIPVFVRIVALPAVTLPVAGRLANYDGLAGKRGFIGIKTGSDTASGGCFAFAARRVVDGHPVIVLGVVLGQARGQTASNVLIAAGLAAGVKLAASVTAALRVATVVPVGRTVVDFANAQGRRVVASTAKPLHQLGWGGLKLRLRVTVAPPVRDLDRGQQVATVVLGGHLRASSPVHAEKSMPHLSLTWRAEHLF